MTADEYIEIIHARRRNAFDRLVKGFKYPHVKRAAQVLDMNVRSINQLRHGDYAICEKRARYIEQRLGLEFGALDLGVTA